MTPDRRKPPDGRRRLSEEVIIAGHCDALEDTSTSLELQALVRDRRFDRQLQLVREHWASVRRLWLEDMDVHAGDRRLRADLPGEFWIGAGMPGLANIKPTHGGCFEFAEDGLTAIIVPAYDMIPGNLDANPERHVEHLLDLVAVNLDQPDQCWRRRGEALVLGSAYLEIADQEGEPIPVFRNPLTWLRSGGAGIVVLDWTWVPDLLLGHELIAEDLDLGDVLEAALKPTIWIRRAAA